MGQPPWPACGTIQSGWIGGPGLRSGHPDVGASTDGRPQADCWQCLTTDNAIKVWDAPSSEDRGDPLIALLNASVQKSRGCHSPFQR